MSKKICPIVKGDCIGEDCKFWVYITSYEIRTTDDDSASKEKVYGCAITKS